jgi:hypothetical protein
LGKRGNLRILTGLLTAQVEDPVVLHGRAARKNDVKTLGGVGAENEKGGNVERHGRQLEGQWN